MEEKLINVPKHVAIIMDGNGRWAEQRGKPRIIGHRAGAKNIRRVAEAAAEAGVEILTLWAFSTENWNRPQKEVDYLMQLFLEFSKKEVKIFQEKNVRFQMVGDISRFSDELRTNILKAQDLTSKNTGLKLIIAANYGGKWDIIQAVKQLAQKVKKGSVLPSDIDEKIFSQYLTLSDLPDPDLLIRTGGELRLSNFLLWQLAYTELYFTDIFWPDFDKKELQIALESYSKRSRRFGGRPNLIKQ